MNEYIQITINALFTGIGVAIGTYYANTYIIKRINKFEKKIKDIKNLNGVPDEQNISGQNQEM